MYIGVLADYRTRLMVFYPALVLDSLRRRALDSQARPVSSSPILVFKLNWEFEYVVTSQSVVINTYMVF